VSAVIDVSADGSSGAREQLLGEINTAAACSEILCIAESVDSVLSQVGVEGQGHHLKWETVATAVGRVLLSIRSGPCPKLDADSVLEYMRAEHSRVHALADSLAEAASRGDVIGLRVRLGLIDRVIRRHMEVEEAHLMPVIASRHGQPRGPAAVLRAEHIEILESLSLLQSLASHDAVTSIVEAEARALGLLMREHGEREEGLVYELADLHLDEEERASLLDFCRAQP